MEPLAGLARVALAQDEVALALQYVTPILAYLEENKLDGSALHPFLVHLRCVQVLQAAGDERLAVVLARARGLVQEQATKIPAGEMRQMFLAKRVNRMLLVYGEE